MAWTILLLVCVATIALSTGMWCGIAIPWTHKPPLPAITLTIIVVAFAATVPLHSVLAYIAAGIGLFSAGVLYVDGGGSRLPSRQ